MVISIELLLIVMVSVAVGYPLFVKKKSGEAVSPRDFSRDGLPHLLAQKDIVYTTLKDIDFDLKMGKLSEEDWRELKLRYEKEAIKILEKIDEVSKKRAHPAKKSN